MSKEIQALVGPSEENLRLDAFMATQAGAPSRAACTKLIEAGEVSINNTLATNKSERVKLGDIVRFIVPDDPTGTPLVPNADIELDIRYEDENLLVISKQAGLACHPSPGHIDDTLANALVARYGYEGLGSLQGPDRPGIVHRLDMDTTGLMVCAKDDETQAALQDLIRMRVLERRYLALLMGPIAFDADTITTGIARSKKNPLRMCVSQDPQAREAITDYQVLERFCASATDEGYTLVECHLWTGRTHQIRVHAQYMGHPCVGDRLYNNKPDKQNLGLKRQFLHSWSLSFEHPVTGEFLRFEDALPEDLTSVLAGLQDRLLERTPRGEEISSSIKSAR